VRAEVAALRDQSAPEEFYRLVKDRPEEAE
jgi:hypothetical protein